jgi:hypothetical protein
MVAIRLAFWPGMDISLYFDCRFLWQSIFAFFPEKGFICSYSAIHS